MWAMKAPTAMTIPIVRNPVSTAVTPSLSQPGRWKGRVVRRVAAAGALRPPAVELAAGSGPVSLVGWSLGGVIAREVARREPDAVRRVITYGTPVVGGPSFTAVAAAYAPEVRRRVAEVSARLDADSPIRVPLTAIWSRRDGIVAWPACLDRVSPDVEHVEVGSTHLGLGVDPDVWSIVASRLPR